MFMHGVLFGVFAQLCLLSLSFCNIQDFVSIDCGSDGSYNDAVTNIYYTSDDQYIDSGLKYKIASKYLTNSPRRYETVRSFPSGYRNCYTLNVVEGSKYLIRASFLYGNYEEQGVTTNKSVQFDMHIGNNFWRTVNISDAYVEYSFDIIVVALTDLMWVCLINTGLGSPFISSLELRFMPSNLYPYSMANQSNSFLFRYNYGPTTDEIIRYPDDPYDRTWKPYSYDQTLWTELSTNSTINDTSYQFAPPGAVLRTAVTPVHSRNLTVIQWDSEVSSNSTTTDTPDYYVVLYFSELEKFPENVTREFRIYLNGEYFNDVRLAPYYFLATWYDYSTGALGKRTHYVFSLAALENSTLPPIINGLEVYSIVNLPNPLTHIDDIHAIINIKERYHLKRNWMGDPCTPTEYAWSEVLCNYNTTPPRIISINLSTSALTGGILDSFQKLQALQYLDLSYNNLTGEIPIFLALLPSLQILSLQGNQFTGQVPDILVAKKNAGLLILNVDASQISCVDGNTCKRRGLSIFVVATILLGFMVLLLLLALIVMFRKKQAGMPVNNWTVQSDENSRNQLPDNEGSNILENECQQFTYAELQIITNNYAQKIGRGGFGTVYHGRLDTGVHVAVKVLSLSSPQGNREFYAEVRHLSRVHHKNLLSLVGYSKDGSFMALVYYYMSGGNLQDYLRGKATRILNMEQRLEILLEASQGVEYLHTACEPPLIHRDVKTSNILLNEKLEAKISDFGLSKAFKNDSCTHISTAVAGTPGYLDPEYQSSYQLNEKSDVYSFGVVILEVLTAQSPIISNPANIHISDWVRERLTQGGLDMVIDVKLLGNYDANCAMKIVDLALWCTMRTSVQRPVMSYVVSKLKECKEAGMDSKNKRELSTGGSSSSKNSDVVPPMHSGEVYLSDVPSAR